MTRRPIHEVGHPLHYGLHLPQLVAPADPGTRQLAFVRRKQLPPHVDEALEQAALEQAELEQHLGLDRVRLHDLRHFQATELIAAGVDVRTVAGRLGHADPATTLRIYAAFARPADERAARVVGRILDEEAEG